MIDLTYLLIFFLAREFVESRKLKGFVVGPDGRARTN